MQEILCMNDFTKDELECFLATLDKVYIAHRTVSQDELQNKLQSLIDNYCEHEPEGDWHVAVDKCKHCGVIVDDNQ